MRSIAAIFYLLVFCCQHALAQGRPELLSVNEGLSQGMVYSMLQSRDGYMWFCTKAGLNRYDGYRFEVFTNDPFDPFSIGFNEINLVFEDSRGWLWIGHWAGIDVLDPNTGRFFHLKSGAVKARSMAEAFAESADGTIWCKALDGKLWRIRPTSDMLERAWEAKQPDLAVQTEEIGLPLEKSPIGHRYFCSIKNTEEQGRRRIFVTSYDWLWEVGPEDKLVPLAQVPSRVAVLGTDRRGRVWLGALEGGNLYYWSKEEGVKPLTGQPSGPFNQLLDRNGFLWRWQNQKIQQWHADDFASGGRPLLDYKLEGALPQNTSFNIVSFYIGPAGIVWMGTNGFGVLKLIPEKPKFQSVFAGTSQFTLGETSGGQIYTEDSRLRWLYDLGRPDEKKPNPWITAFDQLIPAFFTLFDRYGNFWFNDLAGRLNRVDANTKAAKNYAWGGLSLAYNRLNGKFYGVHLDSLLEFDPATEVLKYHPFEQHGDNIEVIHLNKVFVDTKGEIWIGQFGELIRAVPSGNGFRFQYFRNDPKDNSSLSGHLVSCYSEDPTNPDRYLWVGTANNGLNRLDRQTWKFQHFKKAQGLPDDTVYGLLAEGSQASGKPGRYIWMSTNRGLCRLDVLDFSVKNFTHADGLQHNEFNAGSYLKMNDGRMVFGGVNGLTVFHPDSLRFNEHVPLTQIVSLSVNNREMPVPVSSVLRLGHGQNFLSIDFAALEFTNPSRNQYRYRLLRKGFFNGKSDGPWTNLGEKNAVQLANLGPGSYTFEVLGSNNDGKWSEKPAVLRFSIRPPWWASWWAYGAYALAAAGAVYFFNRSSLRQKMERQEALRLRELDEVKNRLYTNITHEFRTPLTVILGMSEQIKSRLESRHDLDRFQNPVSLIRRNGESLLGLVNQMLDLSKLEAGKLALHLTQGDVVGFLRYLAGSFHSLAQQKKIELHFLPDTEHFSMDFDRERLGHVVSNLLSNAVKFTPSGGHVYVQTTCSEALFLLKVQDTGVGIDGADLPHIFERFYQASPLPAPKEGEPLLTPSFGGGRGEAGTGIGLALAHELVKMMHGEISVSSKPGKGTVFTVALPVSRQAQVAAAVEKEAPLEKRVQAVPAPPSPATNGTLPLLLVVEDNADVAEYIFSCLHQNYQLLHAADGGQGIRMAQEQVPDLVLSDVMMPVADGLALLRTLKNDERTSHVPVVLLTAKSDIASRLEGLEHGADGYLSKPFHPKELELLLRNLHEQQRRLQEKYAGMNFVQSLPVSAGNAANAEDVFLQKATRLLLENLGDAEFGNEALARALAMSESQFNRKIKALTGKTLSLFIRSVRLQQGKQLLQSTTLNVSEVAYAVGFTDPAYFSRTFSQEFGEAPSTFRN